MDMSRVIRTSLNAYHQTHKTVDPNKNKSVPSVPSDLWIDGSSKPHQELDLTPTSSTSSTGSD
jgi:hypothetical protein